MKSEWKTTIRVGLVAGLVLPIILTPVFLLKSLHGSPLILVGFALLFLVSGFIAGRQATTHPVWASIVSAFVASLGILLLGLATSEKTSAANSTVEGFERILLILTIAKVAIEIWIQQTLVLIGLSATGGGVAFIINQRKEKSTNQGVIR